MARRRQHPAALKRGAALAIASVLAVTAWPGQAGAHNVWEGAYRKWPWKAGKSRAITTLPGECPHCPGRLSSSAWKAIDVDMRYETVYSIGPGTVERYEPSGGAAGAYVRIKDDDGTFFVYEHLSNVLVRKGRVDPGEPIAVSGCSGNCSGAHLHVQRNDAASFQANALGLPRLSGHGGPNDPLAKTAYESDNAGLGRTADGANQQRIVDAYYAAGGYDLGVTADVGGSWTPCRHGKGGTWFRYACDRSGSVRGSAQTFLGPGERPLAIMNDRWGEAYVVPTRILAAYTTPFGDAEWVDLIGYPTSKRRRLSPDTYRQDFAAGHVLEFAWCEQHVFVKGSFAAAYRFCD